MSVAFRRESDDEHLEPRFELPIPPGPNRVTPRGAELIAARLADLEAAVAGVSGEEEKVLRRDLRYWATRNATVEVVTPPADGTVGIGSRVRYTLDGAAREAMIVGHDEADAHAGLIAFAAPLARAMMGLEEGETATFGGRTIEIVAVE